MKKIYLIIISILFQISGCSDTSTPEEIDGYINDIDIVNQTIKEKHPNPFGFISEEEWDKNIRELKENTKNMSKEEINLKLKDIVADITDAHTNYYFQLSKRDKIYPLYIKWFEEDLRILGTFKEDEDILGYKILGINGTEIYEVIELLCSLYGYDNDVSKKLFSTSYLIVHTYLDYIGVAEGDTITLNLEDNDGNKINKKIKSISSQGEYIDKERIYYSDKFKDRNIHISEQKPEGSRDGYWCKLVEKDNLLFISYKACTDEDFTGFKNEVMKILKDNYENIDSIVFDLRDNGGGNSVYLQSLIDIIKIIDREEKMKVYTFINNGTFSSGALGTINLADRLDATTIGSNTGVIKYSYGDIKEIELPNLDAYLGYSHKTFNYETLVIKEDTLELFKETDDLKRTLGPNVYIEETFEDYKKGVDKCYEYVVNQQ